MPRVTVKYKAFKLSYGFCGIHDSIYTEYITHCVAVILIIHNEIRLQHIGGGDVDQSWEAANFDAQFINAATIGNRVIIVHGQDCHTETARRMFLTQARIETLIAKVGGFNNVYQYTGSSVEAWHNGTVRINNGLAHSWLIGHQSLDANRKGFFLR